jgi:hypothetical protein
MDFTLPISELLAPKGLVMERVFQSAPPKSKGQLKRERKAKLEQQAREDAIMAESFEEKQKREEANRKARALVTLSGHGTPRKKPLVSAKRVGGFPIVRWSSRKYSIHLLAA